MCIHLILTLILLINLSAMADPIHGSLQSNTNVTNGTSSGIGNGTSSSIGSGTSMNISNGTSMINTTASTSKLEQIDTCMKPCLNSCSRTCSAGLANTTVNIHCTLYCNETCSNMCTFIREFLDITEKIVPQILTNMNYLFTNTSATYILT
jgi:hypothetical protein